MGVNFRHVTLHRPRKIVHVVAKLGLRSERLSSMESKLYLTFLVAGTWDKKVTLLRDGTSQLFVVRDSDMLVAMP